MHQPPTRLSRRVLLLSVGGAAALATAGCNPFSTARQTVTVIASAPAPVEPMVNLIATTKLHVLRLNFAITADKPAAAMLTDLRNDRQAHLDALQAEYNRSTGATTAASSAPATGTVTIPGTVDDVIAAIRRDAAQGQGQVTDAMNHSSRFRAALFGSIAACLATHRSVLA